MTTMNLVSSVQQRLLGSRWTLPTSEAERLKAIYVRLMTGAPGAEAEAQAWLNGEVAPRPSAVAPKGIWLNLSEAFLNKDNTTGRQSAYGSSFFPTGVYLSTLWSHICAGKAWTVGCYQKNQRRKEFFQSSQLVALDLDELADLALALPDLLADPDIADYATMVYPSPSCTPENPKYRVIFILETPVTDADAWERLQRGVLYHFRRLAPDPACKDAARLFYGNTHAASSGRFDPAKCLPMSVVEGWAAQAEAWEQAQIAQVAASRKQWATELTGTRREAWARRKLDDMITTLANAGEGQRHITAIKGHAWALQIVSICITEGTGLTLADAERALRQAMSAWPQDEKSKRHQDALIQDVIGYAKPWDL